MNSRLTIHEYRLWVIFHQTYDLVNRSKEVVFAKTASTDQQYLVLWLMELHSDVIGGPLTISDLACLLYRSLNSTSSIVDRMKKNGLIEKLRDLPDERSIRLIMTPKGREILQKISKPYDIFIKQLFSIYSEEELDTLITLLKKLKTVSSQELNITNNEIDPEIADTKKITRFLNKLDRLS